MPDLEPQPIIHLFIPLYFDSESFFVLRDRIKATLPRPTVFHLLDDSAGKDTALEQFSTFPDIEIDPMPERLGHQRAIVLGLRRYLEKNPADQNSILVTMDGDGQDRPEDLSLLLEALESDSLLVIARRTHREEGPAFKALYFFYKCLFRALTGSVILSGNYALYHSKTAKRMLCRWHFDFAYASALIATGEKLKFVPCPRGPRYRGHSKMKLSSLVTHGLSMLLPFIDRILNRGLIASLLLSASSLFFFTALAVATVTGILDFSWSAVSIGAIFLALSASSSAIFSVWKIRRESVSAACPAESPHQPNESSTLSDPRSSDNVNSAAAPRQND